MISYHQLSNAQTHRFAPTPLSLHVNMLRMCCISIFSVKEPGNPPMNSPSCWGTQEGRQQADTGLTCPFPSSSAVWVYGFFLWAESNSAANNKNCKKKYCADIATRLKWCFEKYIQPGSRIKSIWFNRTLLLCSARRALTTERLVPLGDY